MNANNTVVLTGRLTRDPQLRSVKDSKTLATLSLTAIDARLETLLESARRAGLSPPFSCEAGNCGTCIGRLTDGHATMRNNDVLEQDEIDDGYILTCQGVPDSESTTVVYE